MFWRALCARKPPLHNDNEVLAVNQKRISFTHRPWKVETFLYHLRRTLRVYDRSVLASINHRKPQLPVIHSLSATAIDAKCPPDYAVSRNDTLPSAILKTTPKYIMAAYTS